MSSMGVRGGSGALRVGKYRIGEAVWVRDEWGGIAYDSSTVIKAVRHADDGEPEYLVTPPLWPVGPDWAREDRLRPLLQPTAEETDALYAIVRALARDELDVSLKKRALMLYERLEKEYTR